MRLMVLELLRGEYPADGVVQWIFESHCSPLSTGYHRLGSTKVEVNTDARFYSKSISTTSRCYCSRNVDKIRKLIELDHTSLYACSSMHVLAIRNSAASTAIPKCRGGTHKIEVSDIIIFMHSIQPSIQETGTHNFFQKK